MNEKIISINDHLCKKDLEVILEVNRKAVEIEAAVANQNEEVISLLSKLNDRQNEIDAKNKNILDKFEKLSKDTDSISKDLYKIQILFLSGFVSLIVQIIQMFKK